MMTLLFQIVHLLGLILFMISLSAYTLLTYLQQPLLYLILCIIGGIIGYIILHQGLWKLSEAIALTTTILRKDKNGPVEEEL